MWQFTSGPCPKIVANTERERGTMTITDSCQPSPLFPSPTGLSLLHFQAASTLLLAFFKAALIERHIVRVSLCLASPIHHDDFLFLVLSTRHAAHSIHSLLSSDILSYRLLPLPMQLLMTFTMFSA